MSSAAADVLLVGSENQIGRNVPDRLRQLGFRCHFAGSVQTASELLDSQPIDVVLTMASLPDGSGLGLLTELSGNTVAAFLCLPVEDGCVWLPAIDRGKFCWGSLTLRPVEFAQKMEELAHQ